MFKQVADQSGNLSPAQLKAVLYKNDIVVAEKQFAQMMAAMDEGVTPPPQHGLSSNMMALITSYCDAMRAHEHQMALITPVLRALQTGTARSRIRSS